MLSASTRPGQHIRRAPGEGTPTVLTAFCFLMTAVSKGTAPLARVFFFFPQKRQRFEPKWNRQVATLVKWTIISLETAQAHTFIFGPTRSLFSLQKGCLLLGSSCKDSKLLMQAVGVCLRVCLVCISVRACVCVFFCILDLAVFLFSFFSGTKHCPAPSAQSVRTTMTSVLTPSFFPSCLDYTQNDNRAVCRSVSCPTALHQPTNRLS